MFLIEDLNILLMNKKYYINTYNPILSEDLNSIYTYNNKNLNIILYNKNNIINVLLNHYFNLKRKIKINKDKNILFNYSAIIYKELFINNINREYSMSLVKKQHLYISKRKKLLIKWKNKLNLKKNIFNKNKYFNYALSLKRIFVSFPKIKHTNNKVSILINIFNKEKIYLKVKLNKLKSIILTKIYINDSINNKNYSNNKVKFNNVLFIKKILLNILKTKTINILFKRNYLAKLYINNFKFNNTNLINLKNIIYKVYNKEINIYITNIKYIYLDNSIFIESLTRKLNNRKKRVLRVLKQGLHIVKLANINTNILLKVNTFLKNSIKESMFINIIYNNIEYKNIIRNLKNIHVIGINLEAKGRLTRRMTASRSVYKIRSKGTLKNIYNYYYNISSSLIKGTLSPNISSSKNESKNSNGAFGMLSRISTG